MDTNEKSPWRAIQRINNADGEERARSQSHLAMERRMRGMHDGANGRGLRFEESEIDMRTEARAETLEKEQSLPAVCTTGYDASMALDERSEVLAVSYAEEQEHSFNAGLRLSRRGRRRETKSGGGDAADTNNSQANVAEKGRRGRGRGRGSKSCDGAAGETSNSLGDSGKQQKGRGRGRGSKSVSMPLEETNDYAEEGGGRGRRGGRGGRARGRGRGRGKGRVGDAVRPVRDVEQQSLQMDDRDEEVVFQQNSSLGVERHCSVNRSTPHAGTKESGTSTNTRLPKMKGQFVPGTESDELNGNRGREDSQAFEAEKIQAVGYSAAEENDSDIPDYPFVDSATIQNDQVRGIVSQATGAKRTEIDNAGQRIIRKSGGPAFLLEDGKSHREPKLTPDMEEIIRMWLSEIQILSDWSLYSQLDRTSPEVRLKLNADSSSTEECPGIKLPLFKSAAIARCAQVDSSRTCKELLMHVGGPVWALDWCPQRPGWVKTRADIKEFLAVGAHPTSSPYNRLGACLNGKGLIQIWALDLKDYDSEEENQGLHRSLKRRNSAADGLSKRGRGRTTSKVGVAGSGRGKEKGKAGGDSTMGRTGRDEDTDVVEPFVLEWHEDWPDEESSARMVVALAHEGLVTWDAKWQPVGRSTNIVQDREMLRLGFLAVVLGDGSLQVFDVPIPSIFAKMTTSFSDEPLIVNIQPVFRCSSLQKRGFKSIPVSLEWSTWDPHDRLLVGFHDASVAVWKFVPKICATETRPLMFFQADSLPLRSVAWAPDGSGPQGRHLIVTAGHSGWVKFWDLRDIFRPIWDLQTSRCCISSMDWLPFPRCVLMSMDDGTLRLLGIQTASSTTPATGQPWRGTHAQGLQCFLCSSFAIWSVQASRATGLVAYAGASGSVLQFQLNGKEGGRTREPHYLCGAFAANSENGPITLLSANTIEPVQMKKSPTEWGSTPTSKRNFLASCTLDADSINPSDSRELAITCEDTAVPKPKRAKGIAATGTICQVNRHRDAQKNSLLRNIESKELAVTSAPISKRIGEQGAAQSDTVGSCSAPLAGERFPCKSIAVHRVRWNCNHPRRQWLAYGGAAGLVRCQQVYSIKKKKR